MLKASSSTTSSENMQTSRWNDLGGVESFPHDGIAGKPRGLGRLTHGFICYCHPIHTISRPGAYRGTSVLLSKI